MPPKNKRRMASDQQVTPSQPEERRRLQIKHNLTENQKELSQVRRAKPFFISALDETIF